MQGTRKDLYKDSKHPRLNPNLKQHTFNLHHLFETSKLPCSTYEGRILPTVEVRALALAARDQPGPTERKEDEDQHA